MILCGIDEVGRGALAGPLVGCGVIFNLQFTIFKKYLNDSKSLNRNQREKIFNLICESDTITKVEMITVEEINQYGIGWANEELFRRLVLILDADEYILDGNLRVSVRGKSKKIQSIIQADSKIPEVMAASIVAKVTRDKLMWNLAKIHTQYGWETNVGYGTKKHIESLRTWGSCPHHRIVFVKSALMKHNID